ncbi:multidrug resistance-associated protein 1 [Aplysia californica]|uniref:Multidrug resistance-associated protein 1 n=1 Tax=Aplysia californica TaxID=6500 RepID=A0ABM1A542_APLCA|nr:multidrug resistance-associated protein 1 [Aplysia californica]
MKESLLDALESFAWQSSTFWMMFFIYFAYVLIDDSHYLDANTAFQVLNFIGFMNVALNLLPKIVKDTIKAVTSVKRINKFVSRDDLDPSSLHRDSTEDLAVKIKEADFSWEKAGPTTLKSINMEVPQGKLVAVVGTVGCGKSSLLAALLGEMHQLKGYSNLNSSVAYVPQQAWIQNSSLRDNILFGSPLSARYRHVIAACALQSDLDIMPAGDATEIGEKGINLSGGQKQRVSLARAVYSQADIYLLDDPLSAVDSHVGRHIFEQVIGKDGLLGHKVRGQGGWGRGGTKAKMVKAKLQH